MRSGRDSSSPHWSRRTWTPRPGPSWRPNTRSAGSARPTRWRRWWPSWHRTRPASSPAATTWWTVVTPPNDSARWRRRLETLVAGTGRTSRIEPGARGATEESWHVARSGRRDRWASLRDTVRTQLWPLPTVGVVVAVLLGVMLPELDRSVDDQLPAGLTDYLFGGGPDAARTVLQTIAGSLITVTSLT